MLLAAALVPMAGAAEAPPPPHSTQKPVALALLEFLGASDPTKDPGTSDSGGWMAFLSRLDMDKAARGAKTPAQAKAPPAHTTRPANKAHGS